MNKYLLIGYSHESMVAMKREFVEHKVYRMIADSMIVDTNNCRLVAYVSEYAEDEISDGQLLDFLHEADYSAVLISELEYLKIHYYMAKRTFSLIYNQIYINTMQEASELIRGGNSDEKLAGRKMDEHARVILDILDRTHKKLAQ